jgi:peptidoglycan/LPS O-acetylase OafA/YrhL
MNVPVVVDRTSSGKEHFEVLDGLRGSAAFLIVIFHLFNYSFGFQGPWALHQTRLPRRRFLLRALGLRRRLRL